MDISVLDYNSIKIHSKHATFVVDPSERGSKISCDAVIYLNNTSENLTKAVEYRTIIKGPGEYEINGVKFLGVKGNKGFVYSMTADGLSVVFGKTSDISKLKDDTYLSQIVILNVDEEINSSVLTKLEPKIVALYGENKEGAAKILGKDNLPLIKKYTVLKDKMPEEMEVVVLG